MRIRAEKCEPYCPADRLRLRWEHFPPLLRLDINNISRGRFGQVNCLAHRTRHHDDKSAGSRRRRRKVVSAVAPCLKYSSHAGGAKLLDLVVCEGVRSRSEERRVGKEW